MKKTTIIKSSILSVIGLSLITGSAMAKKPGKLHHLNKRHNAERKAEDAAIREERLLDQKDTHGAQSEEGKDKRPSNTDTYHKHTYKRIKALLRSGKINEAEGKEYKNLHTAVTESIIEAKQDGTFTKKEIIPIREELDKINDALTATAGEGEVAQERTPLLNKRQHQIEEAVEAGLKSGRLSTLEANGITRKLARLSKLEDRLKKDKEVSKNEREKLFKEIGEIHRDIKRDLRD